MLGPGNAPSKSLGIVGIVGAPWLMVALSRVCLCVHIALPCCPNNQVFLFKSPTIRFLALCAPVRPTLNDLHLQAYVKLSFWKVPTDMDFG